MTGTLRCLVDPHNGTWETHTNITLAKAKELKFKGYFIIGIFHNERYWVTI